MGKYRFVFEAGVLVRKNMISTIKGFIWAHNLEVTIEEDKSFFSSVYRITATGEQANVDKFTSRLKNFMDSIV